MAENGTFYWNELMTNDVDRAKAFYGATLGWTFDPMPMPEGTYWVAKQGDRPVGGLMDMAGVSPPGVPPHWFAYIAVDDVDRKVANAASLGATILRPAFDISRRRPDRDPDGSDRSGAGLDDAGSLVNPNGRRAMFHVNHRARRCLTPAVRSPRQAP